ncbi:MAG: 50S ribosomal protein L18 [Thermodesulfobacteriota bacterium]
MKKDRKALRNKRHKRIRRVISGTAAIPRICVFKSSRHIYAQIVDDVAGKTMFAASSLTPKIRKSIGESDSKVEQAKAVGEYLGQISVDGGVKKAVFDRGGYPFHGRVKSLASGLREKGVEF